MAFHLTVIGQHTPEEPVIDGAAKIVEVGSIEEGFAMRRCKSPDQLYATVLSAVKEFGAPIAKLDLYDHGEAGHLYMGDRTSRPLFDVEKETGKDVAEQLGKLLLPNAWIRLLGCDVALRHQGKKLLKTMPGWFKKPVVVFGALSTLDASPFYFGRTGFREGHHWGLLYSSTEAALLREDQLPPSYDQREKELNRWLEGLG